MPIASLVALAVLPLAAAEPAALSSDALLQAVRKGDVAAVKAALD